MCQYNLIILEDKYDNEFLTKYGYRKFNQSVINGNAYCKNSCDCGSIVTIQSEFQDISYYDFLNVQKEKKIKELIRIKELLRMPDYREQFEEYLKYSDYYFNEYTSYYDQFDNLTPELELSLSNTEEYKRIDEMSLKNYELDLKYLGTDKYTLNKVPEFVEEYSECDGEIIKTKIQKIPIDDKIEEIKREENFEGFKEFKELYKIYIEILDVVPYFEILPIWISIDENEIKTSKSISINNLKIEDLTKLKKNCKIVITR